MSSPTRQPNFPTAGTTPTEQRTLSELNRFARELVASGLFLLRQSVGPLIVPSPLFVSSLSWGALNRVLLSADASIQLPRLDPRWIGVPLKLILLADVAHTATLVPTGRRISDPKNTPLINDAESLSITGVGTYTLENDGQNWFGPP